MSVPKRFDVLRFFSGLLKVLAWINLVIAILAAIGIAIAGGQAGTFLTLAGDQYAPIAATVAGAGGIFLAIFVLLGGLFYFVLLYALGEMIALQIAIEENTRLTAACCSRCTRTAWWIRDRPIQVHLQTSPHLTSSVPRKKGSRMYRAATQ